MKIDLITDSPNATIDWFNGLYENIAIIDMGHIVNYYTIDQDDQEKWLFHHNTESNEFQCSYHNFWSIIRDNITLDSASVAIVAKLLIDNRFNIEIPKPIFRMSELPPVV